MDNKKRNVMALLPIFVFLALYIGAGVYFEYISPVQGKMGFYVVSTVVAFMAALAVELVQNRKMSFED
ncbi:MAG: Na+/H+ antiporter NhaC family protein, partial [Clostridia bacterium]|nr:Na+/H+ antiporter NhaC family protein [Clostridia bacterium]